MSGQWAATTRFLLDCFFRFFSHFFFPHCFGGHGNGFTSRRMRADPPAITESQLKMRTGCPDGRQRGRMHRRTQITRNCFLCVFALSPLAPFLFVPPSPVPSSSWIARYAHCGLCLVDCGGSSFYRPTIAIHPAPLVHQPIPHPPNSPIQNPPMRDAGVAVHTRKVDGRGWVGGG